ncbi:cytidine and deoxycytidylate deaminase zinc-binding region domain-containing protein [Sarocladium implicatum]|nr:cytidine and deoxycytidylate deaminase zinc-binding region domain-containing protein [Sarocladium implicatum]
MPGPSLLPILLSTITDDILPLTTAAITTGSKVFGASILSRATLKPLTTSTNNERVSPLLHGEVNCIQTFFTSDFPDPANRPDPRSDCIFLATHEPCSLCLSAIAWSGFSEVYFLFTHEDSKQRFGIPHDINILQEVFRVKATKDETDEDLNARPLYNRDNKFFKAKAFADLAGEFTDEKEREKWSAEIERVKALYDGLNETYQQGKAAGTTTSSIWK